MRRHQPASSVGVRRILVVVFVVTRVQSTQRRQRRRRNQRAREVDQHRAQVASVPQQRRRTASSRKQERDRCHVALRRVALRARQHEVVTPVIGRLATAWRHVIECHHRRRERSLAIRAHRTMLGQQPTPGLGVRATMRRRGREARGRRLRPVRARAPRPALACWLPVRNGFGSARSRGTGARRHPLSRFPPAARAAPRRPLCFVRPTRIPAMVAPRRRGSCRVTGRAGRNGIGR